MAAYENGPIDRKLIRRAMELPLLTHEQEIKLTRLWQETQNDRALRQLVEPHLRLVISIAKRFKNYGLPLEDLMQEGVLGLMHAAERYDASRKVRFATYAQWWIRSCMTEHVLRNWSLIRLGTTRSQKSLFFNLRRLRNEIDGVRGETMRPETIAAIAKALKVSPDEVRAMEQRLGARDMSLNVAVGDESGEERGALLVCERPDPELQILNEEAGRLRAQLLGAALEALPHRERRIVEMRRLRDHPMTLEEVGRAFGVSKERVRQLENRALAKIRAHIERSLHTHARDLFEADRAS